MRAAGTTRTPESLQRSRREHRKYGFQLEEFTSCFRHKQADLDALLSRARFTHHGSTRRSTGKAPGTGNTALIVSRGLAAGNLTQQRQKASQPPCSLHCPLHNRPRGEQPGSRLTPEALAPGGVTSISPTRCGRTRMPSRSLHRPR